MVELKNTKTNEVFTDKKSISEKIKKDNPDLSDKEVEEKIVKESFIVKS